MTSMMDCWKKGRRILQQSRASGSAPADSRRLAPGSGQTRTEMPSAAIHLDSRLLSRLRLPVGRFNTELLGILRVQPLPAEPHRLAANDAADGSSAEKVIENIETNVPPGSTH